MQHGAAVLFSKLAPDLNHSSPAGDANLNRDKSHALPPVRASTVSQSTKHLYVFHVAKESSATSCVVKTKSETDEGEGKGGGLQ